MPCGYSKWWCSLVSNVQPCPDAVLPSRWSLVLGLLPAFQSTGFPDTSRAKRTHCKPINQYPRLSSPLLPDLAGVWFALTFRDRIQDLRGGNRLGEGGGAGRSNRSTISDASRNCPLGLEVARSLLTNLSRNGLCSAVRGRNIWVTSTLHITVRFPSKSHH